jgi:hypothetical protein
MSNIIITLKDGTQKKFLHEGRAGGSYTKTLTLRDGFAVITDEWYNKTIIPANDITEIKETPNGSC